MNLEGDTFLVEGPGESGLSDCMMAGDQLAQTVMHQDRLSQIYDQSRQLAYIMQCRGRE